MKSALVWSDAAKREFDSLAAGMTEADQKRFEERIDHACRSFFDGDSETITDAQRGFPIYVEDWQVRSIYADFVPTPA